MYYLPKRQIELLKPPYFILLLICISLLLPTYSYARFDSGVPTESVELAVHHFIDNAIPHADDNKLLGKPNTENASPNRTAAKQMRSAARNIQVQNIIKGFGESLLDAISKVIKLHPGGKGLGTATDLLKNWSESTDKKDFVKKVISGKIKGKVGDIGKQLDGESAKKLAENLYKELEKTLTQVKDIKTKVTLPCAVKKRNGKAKYSVVVAFKKKTINVRLDGTCECKKNDDIESYSGWLQGKIAVSLKDKKLHFKFLGTGLRFGGKLCRDAKPNYASYGSLRLPKPITVKKETPISCTKQECEGLLAKMEKQNNNLKLLQQEREILKQRDPDHNQIPVLTHGIGLHVIQLEKLCKYWNDCRCDTKTDPKFMSSETAAGKKNRLLFATLCVRSEYGNKGPTLLGPLPYLRREDSPFVATDFSYRHLEDFEDHKLNVPGIKLSSGKITSKSFDESLYDSVDADDGKSDGKSGKGDSWWASGSVTISFDQKSLKRYPTHVGVVWTDGGGTVTFEAFDSEGRPLAS